MKINYPVRKINFSLVSSEFEHTRVGDTVCFFVCEFEQHWVDNAQSRESVQSGRWHDD